MPRPHHITWAIPATRCPTVWPLRSCPWLPQAPAQSLVLLNVHWVLAAQRLWWRMLLFTDESLKFPVTSGSQTPCPNYPLLSNSSRPSAQHVEVIAQNLVGWFFRWPSPVSSNSTPTVSRTPGFIAQALTSLRGGCRLCQHKNTDARTVASGPLGQRCPMALWIRHFWFRESNFLDQNHSNYCLSHQFNFSYIELP